MSVPYEIDLNSNNEVQSKEDEIKFIGLRDDQKKKIMLTLPLPGFNGEGKGYKANDTENSKFITSTFMLQGVKFELKSIGYHQKILFAPIIKSDNLMSKEQFIDRYVLPSEQIIDEGPMPQLMNFQFQYPLKDIDRYEINVEKALEQALYNPLKSIMKTNLRQVEKPLLGGFLSFLQNKRLIIRIFGDYTVNRDGNFSQRVGRLSRSRIGPIPEILDLIQLYPIFHGGGYVCTSSFGFRSKSDFICGYSSVDSEGSSQFLGAVGVGEVKTTQLKLEESYSLLKNLKDVDLRGEPLVIPYDSLGIANVPTEAKNHKEGTELQKILKKITTIAVHIGTNKVIVTTYDDFLFIKLKPVIKLQRRSTENSEFLIESSIGCEHILFHSSDQRIREYFLSFFLVNEECIRESNKFRDSVVTVLESQLQEILETQKRENRAADTSNADESPSKRTCSNKAKGKEPLDVEEFYPSPLASSGSSTGNEFSVNPEHFKRQFVFEFSKIIIKKIEVGELLNSQSMVINVEEFYKNLPSSHKFKTGIKVGFLKVFDPDLIVCEDEVDEPYQESLNSCIREIEIFTQLSDLMGDLVPEIYSYGRLIDLEVTLGLTHHYWGPFILMEYLRQEKSLSTKDISDSFLDGKIIPAFKELHSRNVVHGDFKLENLVITEDGSLKIINFEHAKITHKQETFDCEIRQIYKYFGKGPSS